MTVRKKLVIILANYFEQCSGGAELQAYYLAKTASVNGWDVYYIFISNGRPYKNSLNIKLIPINKSFVATKLGNIKFIYGLRIWKLLNKIKPDTIYQRSASALTGISALYSKFNSVNLTYHIASDADIRNTDTCNVFIILEQLLTKYGQNNAKTVIAQTNFQALLFSSRFSRPVTDVISNGHPPQNEVNIHKSCQITLIWVGNMKPLKQPEIFLKLASELKKVHNLKCVMIVLNYDYLELVQEAVTKGEITAPGELTNDEVNRTLNQSHILVNTSKYEGFSNTFIQAWMRKVPVISLNVNPDNVLTTQRIGLHSKNYKQLIEDTKLLISNNAIRNNMANNAKKYALLKHSLSNFNILIDRIDNQ